MGKRHKTFPKESHEEKESIYELKKKVRRLESDNRKLKSELNTLEEAFKLTKAYLRDSTDEFSVDKVIDGVKKGSSLKRIKGGESCPSCAREEALMKRPLPFGTIYLCSFCGFKKVEKNAEETKTDEP